MTNFLLKNFGDTILLNALDASATLLAIAVADAAKFPVPGVNEAFAIILWDGAEPQEIAWVTSNPLDGTLTVLRGQESTTARAWLAGTQIRHFLTAATSTNLLQSGFVVGIKATEAEASAGVVDTKLTTPLNLTQFFAAQTKVATRAFLLANSAAEMRSLLGWETALYNGTGLASTFTLPSASWDTNYTRVYVNEVFKTDVVDYTITGDQLVFVTPPGAGTDNIVVVLGISFAFSVSFPGNNTVSTPSIVAGAVTEPKMANAAVSTRVLVDAAVTLGKMASASATDKMIARASSGAGPWEEIPFLATARGFGAVASLAAGQTYLSSTTWPIPVGMVGEFLRATAPAGWVEGNGGTIGNASSGGTLRANVDTENLFTELWNSCTNTVLPIQTSAGALSTRGASAAADYAANKRLPVPDLRAEFTRGLDNERGIDAARALGSSQAGAIESHLHSVDPPSTASSSDAHTHTLTTVGGVHGANSGSTGTFYHSDGDTVATATAVRTTSSDAHTHTVNIAAFNSASTGGAETRPRNVAVLKCIKL